MRQVREQLKAGILPDERDVFRRQVRGLVARVEEICHAHHVKPAALPAPSYRAYTFLKTLDLDALPIRHTDIQEPDTLLRLNGLLTSCKKLHNSFLALVRQPGFESAALTPEDPAILSSLASLRAATVRVETLCQESAAVPAHLPVRSRRAYQWLKFLEDPRHLMTHLKALDLALGMAHEKACRNRLSQQWRHLDVSLAFFYTSALYRTRVQADGLHIVMHEGFISAPPPVMRALVCTAFSKHSGPHRDQVRRYGHGEPFVAILKALELTTAEAADSPRGRYFDLDTVFERVNAAYFGGHLARPSLVWNQALTHRKMAHYDYVTDTVMVSITLDAPTIPDYVIDFVMYHELLHKALGTEIVNGRRRAHTPDFRSEERKFARYAEADAFLKTLF